MTLAMQTLTAVGEPTNGATDSKGERNIAGYLFVTNIPVAMGGVKRPVLCSRVQKPGVGGFRG
jgi:hypothetical protein